MEKTVADIFEALTDKIDLSNIYEADAISDIAITILQKRISLNMTQTQFGKFLGVQQSMVSKWENGEYNFSVRSIAQICAKLNLTFSINIEEYDKTNAKWAIESMRSSNTVKVRYGDKGRDEKNRYDNENHQAIAA